MTDCILGGVSCLWYSLNGAIEVKCSQLTFFFRLMSRLETRNNKYSLLEHSALKNYSQPEARPSCCISFDRIGHLSDQPQRQPNERLGEMDWFVRPSLDNETLNVEKSISTDRLNDRMPAVMRSWRSCDANAYKYFVLTWMLSKTKNDMRQTPNPGNLYDWINAVAGEHWNCFLLGNEAEQWKGFSYGLETRTWRSARAVLKCV